MTEMLNKELSRKTFLKGGGALIASFSVAGLVGKAQAAESPYASNGPGDMYQIDGWIAIHADNTRVACSSSVTRSSSLGEDCSSNSITPRRRR